ncbi:hypothetical protein [Methylobacterium sp.]|uniref:hypothetical protein n=1 Tax=Methylobacterium sp. TaxID=409 RepID=UPI00351EE995
MMYALRIAAVTGLFLALAGPAGAADACNALTAKLIRATGASLAGRAGSGAVFRAADAERMSLACRAPRRMVFGSLAREPDRPFFALIGRAAEALTGAKAEAVEVLALTLHQDSLLTGTPRQGIAARAALRCETGPREDSLSGSLTVCLVTSAAPLRRRAGLFVERPAG